jgi:hypothetical protein
MADVPFTTSDCGKANGTASAAPSAPLEVGDRVAINGSTDLSPCVIGNSDARVFSIELAKGTFDGFSLTVVAQGPSGILSGSMDLVFIDGTGDQYKLAITSSSRKAHSLGFNSSIPGIVSFMWS